MYSSTCFCMYLDLFILGMAGFVLWAHLCLYSGHVCICNTWRRVRRSYCRGNFGGFERIRRRQHSLYLCPRIFPREHLIIIKKKILKQDSLNPVDSFSQFCDMVGDERKRFIFLGRNTMIQYVIRELLQLFRSILLMPSRYDL